MIINFTDIKGKHEAVVRILEHSLEYFNEQIYPQLLELTNSEHDLFWLKEYAKGSILIWDSIVQKFKVIEHYKIFDKCSDIFVIEKADGELYGFLIDDHGLARYGKFAESGFRQYLCNNSRYIHKTIGEVLNDYDIPHASQIPYVYIPFSN